MREFFAHITKHKIVSNFLVVAHLIGAKQQLNVDLTYICPMITEPGHLFQCYWHVFSRKFLVNSLSHSVESLTFGDICVSVGVGFASVLGSFQGFPVRGFLPHQIYKNSTLNYISYFSKVLTKPSLFHIIFISSLPATWKANSWLQFLQNGSNTAILHSVHRKKQTQEKFTHRKIHMMNFQVALLTFS